MKLFQKAANYSQKLYQKGQSEGLFKKGGNFLQAAAPVLGLINPSFGVAAGAIGKAISH
jgi:hypothetical protein